MPILRSGSFDLPPKHVIRYTLYMLTKEKLSVILATAIVKSGIVVSKETLHKFTIDYPDPQFGDYSTNAALILSKETKNKPRDLAEKIIEHIDKSQFEKIEIAGPGFLNFTLKNETLLQNVNELAKDGVSQINEGKKEKVLVEYFQPNIAKPLHIGHLRTAIIGDAVKRMHLFLGYDVQSDTHLGDWGTQFGLLVLAYKKWGNFEEVAKDPIPKLNELYIKINSEIEKTPELREEGKLEFVKLEKGDVENRKIWLQFVNWSLEKFMRINDLMDILPFDHDWPESFFEDKMPAVLQMLKEKELLEESQGAQVVNLESEKLGFAVLVKSDTGTTYLLRDLATFIFRKEQGFEKQLYVVDNRQSFHFQQMFAILRKLGITEDVSKSVHIDYGYMSFKGEALSTRKGNMVLADDVITTAEKRVAEIIKQKNPDLKNQDLVVKAVSRGALKYYDLSHNRHSDIDFDWEQALDFDGNSGPYLQYTYARFSSILRKVKVGHVEATQMPSESYKRLAFLLTIFNDRVVEAMKDYLPNTLANYLYDLAKAMNHFYHESSIDKEEDLDVKKSKYTLVIAAKNVLGKGLDLLGIRALEEM